MESIVIPIISVLSVFVAAPAIVFFAIYRMKKLKHDAQRLEAEKELMELEIEKKELELRILQAEGRKYDRLIEGNERKN